MDKSQCEVPGFIPDYVILRNPDAVKIFINFMHGLTWYKIARDYALSKDTYYVESFNNTCVICIWTKEYIIWTQAIRLEWI